MNQSKKPVIEVNDVYKYFGSVKAVDGVSFSVDAGEIFGIIGPNGAGKTTLLRMIMNIIGPDKGRILFNGGRLEERDKEKIGYLPEERGLYKKVKVLDMLVYLAELKGLERQVARKAAHLWLKRFGLQGWALRKVETLSKGMAQKVQFIASVIHNPLLLILDEPFAGLDPVSTDVLRDYIQEIRNSGGTVLFSTHNMEQAEKICSRILMVNNGREVLKGRLDEIKERFGRKTVTLEFEGSLEFLKKSELVAGISMYPRYAEVELTEDADPDLLFKLIATNADSLSVKRYELMTPSLHKIFVDQVALKKEREGRQ